MGRSVCSLLFTSFYFFYHAASTSSLSDGLFSLRKVEFFTFIQFFFSLLLRGIREWEGIGDQALLFFKLCPVALADLRETNANAALISIFQCAAKSILLICYQMRFFSPLTLAKLTTWEITPEAFFPPPFGFRMRLMSCLFLSHKWTYLESLWELSISRESAERQQNEGHCYLTCY